MKSIKFGDKTALQIVSNNFKNDIKNNIRSVCNMEIGNRYYNFLNEKNLHNLNSNNYKVCINTFGHKYLLFMTNYKDKNYNIFINKKNENMICVKFNFNEKIYNNTLFDGELMKNNDNKWVYIITDIITYDNNFVLKNKNLVERIELIDDIFNNYKCNDSTNYCMIDVKKYFKLKYLLDIKNRYMDSVPYKCSGIYFQHNTKYNSSYMYIFPEFRSNNNTNIVGNKKKVGNTINKVDKTSVSGNSNNSLCENSIDNNSVSSNNNVSSNNSVSENSIDKNKTYNFKIEKTDMPDIYRLYNSNNGNIIFYDYAGIPNLETSKLLDEIFTKNDINIMTCEYSDNINKWIPKYITNDNIGYS